MARRARCRRCSRRPRAPRCRTASGAARARRSTVTRRPRGRPRSTDVRGQSLDYELAAPLTFDRLDLTVFADGRHSVPRRLRLEVDGAVRELTVPEITDQPGENATRTVPLTFAAGHRVARAGRRRRDPRRDDVQLLRERELALAGWHRRARGSGARRARASRRARGGVPRRPADGRRRAGAGAHRRDAWPTAVAGNPLAIEPCAPAIDLDAGSHELRTAPGIDTGVQIDRLVLASDVGGEPLAVDGGQVTGLPDTPPPVPDVRSLTTAGRGCACASTARPNPSGSCSASRPVRAGRASTDGAHVGERRLVAGYANGWLIDPDRSRSRSFWSGRRSGACGLRSGCRCWA